MFYPPPLSLDLGSLFRLPLSYNFDLVHRCSCRLDSLGLLPESGPRTGPPAGLNLNNKPRSEHDAFTIEIEHF